MDSESKINNFFDACEIKVNEDFFNPFAEEETKNVKPTHIKDNGGLLAPRKESFNASRIEYIKRGANYIVRARTHFGANETVEICPVILLGSECTAIDNLKDIVFEIDKKRDEWGLVLGYGALYSHADKPNLVYAYNKKTKQMHFITSRIVQAGEALTINYGSDYWVARKEFNTMGDYDKGEPAITRLEVKKINPKGELEESEVQPNAADMDQNKKGFIFKDPNSKANPAVSGVAFKGGQS